MRLPIFELDGKPAAEGSFDLEVSEPSLCGGEEVISRSIYFPSPRFEKRERKTRIVARWSRTILLNKSSRTDFSCFTGKNVRTHVLTLRSIIMMSCKQLACFVDPTILPGRLDVLREQSAWRSAAGLASFWLLEVQASQFVKMEMIPIYGIRRTIKPAWDRICTFLLFPFSSKQ